MTADSAPASVPRPPLRLWPGVLLVACQWFLRLALPAIDPEMLYVAVMGSVLCGALVFLWWLLLSRAPWRERLAIFLLFVAALAVARMLVHSSIAGGMMGLLLPVSVIPVASTALVAAAVLTRNRGARVRRVALAAAMVLCCGAFTLLRTGGITGTADSDFHWRWTATPEERLLAAESTSPRAAPAEARTVPAPAPDLKAGPSWPGFRGPGRDNVVRGTRIGVDWNASPPVERWRRSVGPGWSSFALAGGLVYTQEQRGEQEVVSCYDLATGEPVWHHQDAVRFYESNAGAGPRATPTWHAGYVYTLGATGLVNALDARTGARAWQRDAAADAKKARVPDWGFAGSPLVVGDLVVVAASGSLLAYERSNGALRWAGPPDGGSYSSPHLVAIGGVPQVLLMSRQGLTSVAPSDGRVLWQHAWTGFGIVQPAEVGEGDFLISTGDRIGARRIAVKAVSGAWQVEERWTSNRLKAYFNDYVLHRGHAYGFDGGILTCVDLADGARRWKGGRYGSGQVLLLADQDLLLVLSEQGELALVRAAPDEFAEVARRAALPGKTWNHPVLAGDTLLVRNDREMAAFRLQ